MDKLKMAHDYFMKHVNTDQYRHLDDEVLILWSFDYVDAMQAESDKREPFGLPEALCGVGGFTGSHIMERPDVF